MCSTVLAAGAGGYRAKYFTGPGLAPPPILALGLSSRKNLCVHPSVAGARLPAARPELLGVSLDGGMLGAVLSYSASMTRNSHRASPVPQQDFCQVRRAAEILQSPMS